MKRCYIIKEHRAIADLCDHLEGLIITRINVPVASRGQGVGRRLLKEICDDADASKETLYLDILASGGPSGLTMTQLKAWYKRYGFVKMTDQPGYIRVPR